MASLFSDRCHLLYCSFVLLLEMACDSETALPLLALEVHERVGVFIMPLVERNIRAGRQGQHLLLDCRHHESGGHGILDGQHTA